MRKEEIQTEDPNHQEQKETEEEEIIMPIKKLSVPTKFPSGEKISKNLQKKLRIELKRTKRKTKKKRG